MDNPIISLLLKDNRFADGLSGVPANWPSDIFFGKFIDFVIMVCRYLSRNLFCFKDPTKNSEKLKEYLSKTPLFPRNYRRKRSRTVSAASSSMIHLVLLVGSFRYPKCVTLISPFFCLVLRAAFVFLLISLT